MRGAQVGQAGPNAMATRRDVKKRRVAGRGVAAPRNGVAGAAGGGAARGGSGGSGSGSSGSRATRQDGAVMPAEARGLNLLTQSPSNLPSPKRRPSAWLSMRWRPQTGPS